jgi:hypothetical protein
LRLFLPIVMLAAAPVVSGQHLIIRSAPDFPSRIFGPAQSAEAICVMPQGENSQNQEQPQPAAKPAQQNGQQGPGEANANGSQQGAGAAGTNANANGTQQQQPPPQPKRILGVMPNFRAVSAGELPPPPTPKQAFKIATQNSFDYSSFIFVGITSALAEWTGAHPQLGEGMPGFGRYYWRGFVDKTDGNYLVIFALPTVLHEDERYYAMGKGSFWKRAVYSSTRIFITPNYQGHDTVNISELLGRAISQGISLAYYPSQTRTPGAIGAKFGYALGRDALTNVFREFWPDISVHVLHRHP